MEILGIKYTGPVFDNSGYARACRGNILALHKSGVPVTINPISFEQTKPELGEDGDLLRALVNKDIEYNVQIIHTTPEFWSRYKDPTAVNVGYTIFETTKLHPAWPDYINNNVTKVLVGCEWNVEVFEKSGVIIPIGVVPHGIDMKDYKDIEPYEIGGASKDDFIFYDIFQWQERKHPIALLKAYYHAFAGVKDVNLVLKTYRSDYSDKERDAIRSTIKSVRNMILMDDYPKISFIHSVLSEGEMASLHARGDCYVSLDRGEGFGLGPFQAGAMGNPIIVTGFGGTTEYAKEDNSYLINYQLTPVFGMGGNPWYRGDQLWAEPDIVDAARLMRYVYDNREEAKARGGILKDSIKKNFSWEVIAGKIIKELEEL